MVLATRFSAGNQLRSSSLYSGNPIISKEISGNFQKSEDPSAEAIKTTAALARRWRDGGVTAAAAVAAAVARRWFWQPEWLSGLYSGNPIISKEISGKKNIFQAIILPVLRRSLYLSFCIAG